MGVISEASTGEWTAEDRVYVVGHDWLTSIDPVGPGWLPMVGEMLTPPAVARATLQARTLVAVARVFGGGAPPPGSATNAAKVGRFVLFAEAPARPLKAPMVVMLWPQPAARYSPDPPEMLLPAKTRLGPGQLRGPSSIWNPVLSAIWLLLTLPDGAGVRLAEGTLS